MTAAASMKPDRNNPPQNVVLVKKLDATRGSVWSPNALLTRCCRMRSALPPADRHPTFGKAV